LWDGAFSNFFDKEKHRKIQNRNNSSSEFYIPVELDKKNVVLGFFHHLGPLNTLFLLIIQSFRPVRLRWNLEDIIAADDALLFRYYSYRL